MESCKQLLGQEGGRIMVFGSGMCQLGLGALKTRDDVKVYNSDKEKLLF